jgi:hypothetical protein
MIRIAFVSLALILLVLSIAQPGAARPEFLAAFQKDAFRRAEMDGCVVCHINPRGGGPRNDFGTAFQAADNTITPLLRASFPDRFKFESAKLPNGTQFHFSDPDSKLVVYEKDQTKTVIDLTTMSAKSEKAEAPLPPRPNRMSFFVTSVGVGKGAHLGGLAGADAHCQALAEAAGAGDRTWRAYLSTSFENSAAINAGDRIGSGPWFNAKGELVARGVAELHSSPKLGKESALTEKGETVGASSHDILTGSLPNGTAAVGMTCNNWLSQADGTAMVGHSDRQGNGEAATSWNSAHPTRGCSQPNLVETGGAGLFYCFAAK